MLPRGLLESLAVWGLLHECHAVVRITYSSEVRIPPQYLTYSREEFEAADTKTAIRRWRDFGWQVDIWYKSGTAMGGLMNRHEFSGRVL